MHSIMIEAVLMAFVIGGIVGAISALHLARPHTSPQQRPVPMPIRQRRR